jgi:hypothetical protein
MRIERMVVMRTVLDVLRLLFFPGLGTLLAGGSLLLFLDRKAAELILGGPADGGGVGLEGQEGGWTWSPQAGFFLSASLVALGLGVLSLIGARGNLLVLALLFASAEALPLAALREAGTWRGEAFLPLAFRTAFLRATTFLFLLAAASLRYPGGPDISLRSFQGEHLFASLALWEGPGRLAVAAALGAGAFSAVLLVLGDPGWENGLILPGGGHEGLTARCLRAAERGFLVAVFPVLFLGYPGEGNGGYTFWLPATLGWLLLSILLRAGFSRWGRVGRRKSQWWAAVPALLSLALMVGASALG